MRLVKIPLTPRTAKHVASSVAMVYGIGNHTETLNALFLLSTPTNTHSSPPCNAIPPSRFPAATAPTIAMPTAPPIPCAAGNASFPPLFTALATPGNNTSTAIAAHAGSTKHAQRTSRVPASSMARGWWTRAIPHQLAERRRRLNWVDQEERKGRRRREREGRRRWWVRRRVEKRRERVVRVPVRVVERRARGEGLLGRRESGMVWFGVGGGVEGDTCRGWSRAG
ncbi:hypothetical protein P152DRAFT_12088 [Eremomyces bilateralis CBS 781.70]|uniref:Uncharacterized protein n=1 Tax=Eremomyces bilateralis CBS 781.70 TaxID=1392243 RepID=A0A6G1GH62_9PEZI|nr:uncharacterized protein P152DRAFT_12088 [Eremomyces bilateralis CBS 781.70]KAF1817241.1 hypothetical protein P152DRAFT_12088 [Eremomyces bilateralis CBS 781.70]